VTVRDVDARASVACISIYFLRKLVRPSFGAAKYFYHVKGEAVRFQELPCRNCFGAALGGQRRIVPPCKEAQLVELGLAVSDDHQLGVIHNAGARCRRVAV